MFGGENPNSWILIDLSYIIIYYKIYQLNGNILFKIFNSVKKYNFFFYQIGFQTSIRGYGKYATFLE